MATTGNVITCSATVEQLQADTPLHIGELITALLPADVFQRGKLVGKISGFGAKGFDGDAYTDLDQPINIGVVVKAALNFTHLNDLRVEFIWTVDEQTQAVVDLRIVG